MDARVRGRGRAVAAAARLVEAVGLAHPPHVTIDPTGLITLRTTGPVPEVQRKDVDQIARVLGVAARESRSGSGVWRTVDGTYEGHPVCGLSLTRAKVATAAGDR